jgi:hypothetical protein
VEGSSPGFLLNFRIYDGNLEGITDHGGLWEIGSFVNHDKFGKSKVARTRNDANEDWEGGEVSVVLDGPCCPPIFLPLEGLGVFGE